MSTSPMDHAGQVVTTNILLDGSPINDAISVWSITIDQSVYDLPSANIELLLSAGGNGLGNFGDSSQFNPGKEVEIQVGYDDNNHTLFKGLLLNYRIRQDAQIGIVLTLTCQDKAVALTIGRSDEQYENLTDGAILKKVISEASIGAEVDSTSYQHKQLVKYQTTDWDFIVLRAKANGMFAYAQDGTVFVKKTASYGDSCIDLNLRSRCE